MSHLILKSVLKEFDVDLSLTETHASYAHHWMNYRYLKPTPQFTYTHRDIFVEAAFLSAFQAWEEFLEESFILYILGKKPPRGKRLRSLVPVKTRKHAKHLLLQGKPYLDWSPVNKINVYNKSMFTNYAASYFHALNTIESPLNEISNIRNAIAHRSESSWNVFKSIVRNRLRGSFPPDMTVGKYLVSTVPDSSPPERFLDHYLEHLRYGASLVVPS